MAGINLYNQVDEAEALDSALTKRAEIEALNIADRSGGALDLAWMAEGGKLTAKMEVFERNINRILQAGGTANEQSHWKEHYNMYQCAIKATQEAYMPNAQRKRNTCASMRMWQRKRRPHTLHRQAIQCRKDIRTAERHV